MILKFVIASRLTMEFTVTPGSLDDPSTLEAVTTAAIANDPAGSSEILFLSTTPGPSQVVLGGSAALEPPGALSDEIDALYAELRVLAVAARTDASEEARYQECLNRLRARQAEEARAMAMFAERRRQLPRDAFDALSARVAALLRKHEGSSV